MNISCSLAVDGLTAFEIFFGQSETIRTSVVFGERLNRNAILCCQTEALFTTVIVQCYN